MGKENIDGMFDTSWFDSCRIFDDVLLVTNISTSCFVVKTFEGLVLIDSILGEQGCQRYISQYREACYLKIERLTQGVQVAPGL